MHAKKMLAALMAVSVYALGFTALAYDDEKPTKKEIAIEYFESNKTDLNREEHEIIVRTKNDITDELISDIVSSTKSDIEYVKAIHKNFLLFKTDYLKDALKELGDNEKVLFATENYKLHTMSGESVNSKIWAIDNYGQTVNGKTGTPHADLNITAAWEITKGNEDVIVAIIDTGVDISHPALSSNIWINPDEQEDVKDSDYNGYNGDLHGWDFVNGDSSVFDNIAVDEHVTHVAGIIAANGSNLPRRNERFYRRFEKEKTQKVGREPKA